MLAPNSVNVGTRIIKLSKLNTNMNPKFQKNQSSIKLNQGLALHKAGKYAQARKIYEDILKINPNHFDAIQLLGTIALQTCEYEKAIELLSLALKIDANNFSVLTNLGNTFKDLKRFEDAITCYDKAVLINKDMKDAYLNRGVCLHQLFKYEEAISSFDEAIKINASFTEAHYSRGLALKELKKYEDAIHSFDESILANKNFYQSYNLKGIVLQHLNRLNEALICFDLAINLRPDFRDAYNNRGNVFKELGRLDEALTSYNRAIEIDPGHSATYSNRGNTLRELGEYDSALESFKQAIKLNPELADAYFNQGLVLHELKEFITALESFVKAINLKQDFIDAYIGLGDTLQEMGRFNEALNSYELAINLNPKSHIAYCNQGIALHELRKFNAAIQSYEKAINIESDRAEVFFNLGNAYEKLGKLNSAIESYERAISIKADYAGAYLNRGAALQQLKQFNLALESYEKAFYLNPNLEHLFGTILFLRLSICDWSDLGQSLLFVESKILNNEKVIIPFSSLVLFDAPKLHYLTSTKLVDSKFPTNNTLGEISNPPHHRKLRIGYYSADLYYHPASIWLAEQLENHDRSKFELIAFSFKSISDPMKDRLKTAFDHWVDARDLSDLELVQISRDLKIDIAIDLNTHTTDARLGVFAARVAPIQVMNIGYPGSSGAQYIDYFLSDSYGVSQDNRPYFREKIAFVPSLTTYDRQREVSNEPLYRSQFGLPETGFVFTCQNGCQKFSPDVFDIWMEILKAVPGSVLWLLKPNESAVQNLIKEAQIRGIDSERLIFTDREVVPMEQEKNRISRYLASYKLADLFLDTWPYNAGTTAVDALWAGTPVITKVGNAISARMCYAALKLIELPELITYTANEYKDLAIGLATDPDRLKLIKEKLEKNRLSTALFDPVGNTRHIENAYLEMYRRYSEGLPPSDIYIGA